MSHTYARWPPSSRPSRPSGRTPRSTEGRYSAEPSAAENGACVRAALRIRFVLDSARVVVSIDSDFLMWEGSPVKQAYGYGRLRAIEEELEASNRLLRDREPLHDRLRLSDREIRPSRRRSQ